MVVVGNGMVGHRFIELLLESDHRDDWAITTFCEEPRLAYDRVNLTSFFDGMGALIGTLSSYLGDRLKTGAKAAAIDKKGDRWVVHMTDGASIETDAVVLATPAFETSEMVRGINKELSSTLSGIYYPSISVVCLGYRQDRIADSLDGFGFLIPSGEGRKILGTLWDSSIFPNRAPEGYVLLRSMLGGVRRSELA